MSGARQTAVTASRPMKSGQQYQYYIHTLTYVCMYVCMCVYLYVCVCVFVCLFACLLACLLACLFVCLFCLCLLLFVCSFICLFVGSFVCLIEFVFVVQRQDRHGGSEVGSSSASRATGTQWGPLDSLRTPHRRFRGSYTGFIL